jgi:hypothetical protein
LGRGSCGGEGRRVHHLVRMRFLASKSKEWDRSDLHVEELSTQQKQKQNMLEKNVEHILNKNKLRIGLTYFETYFSICNLPK